MSKKQLTSTVPFYKIPSEGDKPLFVIQSGIDASRAREVVDYVMNFLAARASARVMGEQDEEEDWIHWFLLKMVKSLREASGDVQ